MSTVMVTGGSRGIGAATVRLFVEKGHRVFFLYEKNHEAAIRLFGETIKIAEEYLGRTK